MNIFTTLPKSIIRMLYNKYVLQTDDDLENSKKDVEKYTDTKIENMTAIVASTLSVYAVSDSDITVTGDNRRAQLLQSISDAYLPELKARVADCLGTGMLISVPYSVDNGLGRKIYIDTVPKDRFFITGLQGDEITQCTVAADYKKAHGHKYIRWADYGVENGIYTIRNRATCDGKPISLQDCTWWTGVADEIKIGGVDRLPVAIMRCPASSRKADKIEGVPITYGCGETIKKILSTLDCIEKEFHAKGTKVFASYDMFDKNGKISANTFVKAESDGEDVYQVFSPEIRFSAYYDKLKAHFDMLESEIGCSGGILSRLETSTGTATEVRRAMYKTFSLCSDIQKRIEKYYNDLMYSCDVLANYYGLTPSGDYDVNYSWSYGLLEDSAQTFAQYKDGAADGVIKKAEYRQYITGESLEDAQKAIDEIDETEPSLSKMLQGNTAQNQPANAVNANAEQ